MRSDKREFSGAFPVVMCFPVQRLYHRIDRTLKVKLVTEVGKGQSGKDESERNKGGQHWKMLRRITKHNLENPH